MAAYGVSLVELVELVVLVELVELVGLAELLELVELVLGVGWGLLSLMRLTMLGVVHLDRALRRLDR